MMEVDKKAAWNNRSVRALRFQGMIRPALLVGLCTLLSASFSAVPSLFGQKAAASEYEVKAAYLYNFARFVAWPDKGSEPTGEPFEICVLGQDPFGPSLSNAINGETIGGKSLAAKRIAKPQDINSCRILFISASEEGRLSEDMTALDKTNVLTVSDIPRFSDRGGMIEFILDGSRVRFEVNLKNAQDAGLSLSSELLKVAVRVTKSPHPGN